jgi:hypothetical protein
MRSPPFSRKFVWIIQLNTFSTAKLASSSAFFTNTVPISIRIDVIHFSLVVLNGSRLCFILVVEELEIAGELERALPI